MPIDIAEILVALLPRLVRYARVLTRSADAADDLVQAACERALATANGPGDGVPFDAWMFRIVRNLWIDQKRRAGVEVLVDDPDDPAALDAPSVAGHHAPDAADAAGDRLLLAQVQRAIDTLPAEQREVLLLVAVEEKSYRDAADLLGVPIGTVMSRLARARGRLAQLAAGAAPAERRGIDAGAARLRSQDTQ